MRRRRTPFSPAPMIVPTPVAFVRGRWKTRSPAHHVSRLQQTLIDASGPIARPSARAAWSYEDDHAGRSSADKRAPLPTAWTAKPYAVDPALSVVAMLLKQSAAIVRITPSRWSYVIATRTAAPKLFHPRKR